MPEKAKRIARVLLRSPLPWSAAASAFLLWAHEPWRDEAQAWLIARDTPFLTGILGELPYEGTPVLWHLLLLPLAKAGLPFLAERVLHSLLALSAVAVAWFAAPFPRWAKWLFPFGYFTAYEFNAVARNYVLVFLLLLVLAALDRVRFERPVAYGGCLALLANASVHGLVLAAVLAAAHGIDLLRRKGWTRRTLAAAGVAAAGMALAALQVRQPPDLASYLKAWNWSLGFDRFQFAADIVATSFAPIPAFKQPFWNTDYLADTLPSATLLHLLGLGLLVVSCLALRRHQAVLWTYVAGALLLLALFVFKDYRGARHAGLLFALFLWGLWVVHARPAADAPPAGTEARARARWRGRRPARAASDWRVATLLFFGAVLAAQAVGGAIIVRSEATGTFSQGQAAAAFLESHGLADGRTLVVGYKSYTMAPVLAHLHDRSVRFYYPEFQAFGSHTRWSTVHEAGVGYTLDDVLARSDPLSPGYERTVFILDSSEMRGTEQAQARLVLLGTMGSEEFGVWNEQYAIFEVLPPGG